MILTERSFAELAVLDQFVTDVYSVIEVTR